MKCRFGRNQHLGYLSAGSMIRSEKIPKLSEKPDQLKFVRNIDLELEHGFRYYATEADSSLLESEAKSIFLQSSNMAKGTYEFECMRAELLGLENPNKEEFQLKNDRIKAEHDTLEAQAANELEGDDSALNSSGGKFDELNSILLSTQNKLNRFKKNACCSLANIFQRKSTDSPSTSNGSDGNALQSDLSSGCQSNMLVENNLTKLQSKGPVMKNSSLDIQNTMTSHLDTLDSLISKADNAAFAAQNKQMKKFLQ